MALPTLVHVCCNEGSICHHDVGLSALFRSKAYCLLIASLPMRRALSYPCSSQPLEIMTASDPALELFAFFNTSVAFAAVEISPSSLNAVHRITLRPCMTLAIFIFCEEGLQRHYGGPCREANLSVGGDNRHYKKTQHAMPTYRTSSTSSKCSS